MVQIGPYGRGSVWFTGIGKEDVFECVRTAKRLFSIDEDRVYLCGFSMGGAATFNLGLSYPDAWAACVPVCGRCGDLELVANGSELPFWINTGADDALLPPECSRNAYRRAEELGFEHWRYTENVAMGHSFRIDWKHVEQWLLGKTRAAPPKRVSFCTRSLDANKAYWLEVTGVERYGEDAGIEAEIHGQTISVEVRNVSNYKLHLNRDIIDLERRVEINENGNCVYKGILSGNGCFVRRSQNDGVIKRRGLCGPLWAIYSNSCVLVYGTGGEEPALVAAARRCACSFSHPRWMDEVNFRIMADTALTEDELKDNNLVLFGNASTNAVLARIQDRIPIWISGECVFAGRREYRGGHLGYCLIYPNPLNPARYVAVFAGNSVEAIDCFDKIWPTFKAAPRDIDYGVFELEGTGRSLRWRLKGLFGTTWEWQH
jgi:hypothetical protein